MALSKENKKKIEDGVRLMLEGLGEDLTRNGIANTPVRVAKLYEDILDGHFAELPELTSFDPEKFNGPVMVHHVPFYAFCEHHMLPFIGHFSMGYVPDKQVLGLSKLVRIFRQGCKRLTIHERITQEAVDLMMKEVQPKGAICYVTAEHTCMSLRGVKSPGSWTTTVAYKGIFEENPELRQLFVNEASKVL